MIHSASIVLFVNEIILIRFPFSVVGIVFVNVVDVIGSLGILLVKDVPVVIVSLSFVSFSGYVISTCLFSIISAAILY